MISFAVRVKESKVRGDLVKFREYLGTLTKTLLTQEACLTAKQALNYAPPIIAKGGQGFKKEAETWGNRAIDRDVRLIFARRDATLPGVFSFGNAGSKSAFTKWRANALGGDPPSIIRKIHSDPDEDKAYTKALSMFGDGKSKARPINNAGQMRLIHDGQRKQGTIKRSGGPSQDIKRNPYIARDSMIKAYVKKRQLQVGKLKSGWWSIISTYGKGLVIFGRVVDSGQKNVAKFIKRHAGPGTLSLSMNGQSKRVTIVNRIGDNDGAGLRTDTVNLVIRDRLAAIAKRPYQVYANRIVRNWNKSLPPSA